MLKFEDYKLLQNVFRHFLFSMQRKESNLLDFLQLENGFQRVCKLYLPSVSTYFVI